MPPCTDRWPNGPIFLTMLKMGMPTKLTVAICLGVESILAPILTGVGALMVLVIVGIYKGWFKGVKPMPTMATQTSSIASGIEYTSEVVEQSSYDENTIQTEKTASETKVEASRSSILLTEQTVPEPTSPLETPQIAPSPIVETSETQNDVTIQQPAIAEPTSPLETPQIAPSPIVETSETQNDVTIQQPAIAEPNLNIEPSKPEAELTRVKTRKRTRRKATRSRKTKKA